MKPEHPFAVTRKAERLTRAHENVLFEAKVMTDIRPVFNVAGDKILHTVITHSLLIDYIAGNQFAKIEIGLDAGVDYSACRPASAARAGDRTRPGACAPSAWPPRPRAAS
jgi:hypothetical protein